MVSLLWAGMRYHALRSGCDQNHGAVPTVCTENLIRVDGATNRLSWRNDRAALFRSGRPGLAIQVEVAT